jgi:hypothetical protein
LRTAGAARCCDATEVEILAGRRPPLSLRARQVRKPERRPTTRFHLNIFDGAGEASM